MSKVQWREEGVLTISDFMPAKECESFVSSSEGHGFEQAAVSSANGPVMMKSVRNNDRVIWDDAGLVSKLWARLKSFMPSKFAEQWRPSGLNERFRFYRYDVGQQFDWHQDGYFERENGERSQFTFMVYLNDDFDGGETSFALSGRVDLTMAQFKIEPAKGMALLFHHPIWHKGEPVTQGRKYVLRSDVLYERIAERDHS